MNTTQLKWLMYYSEGPKLATNLFQMLQLWTEFQTTERLEWACQMHLHLGCSQVSSTLLACAAVSTALAQQRATTQKHKHLSAARRSSPSLQ